MGRGETNAKKRKRKHDPVVAVNGPTSHESVDTSKPTAVFRPTKGRQWTVSVAIPGSIIANAQTHELRTSLVGHIARALSVFCVDEVIVFNDGAFKGPRNTQTVLDPTTDYTGTADPDHFLVHLLSYLETPPHLRKLLFPIHPNLRTAGTLQSLDLPHHLKSEEWCPYREGVTTQDSNAQTNGQTLVEAGLKVPVRVNAEIPPKTRVTLGFGADAQKTTMSPQSTYVDAEAISPDVPREQDGYYWGFNVRKTGSLSTVFTECAYDGGYDLTIGTSERGMPLEELYGKGVNSAGKFKHLLVVFGGVAGLEVALKNDSELQGLGVNEVKDVFDRWVNVCPGQGSRTIRTEEAVWIGLMGLRRLVESN